MEIDVHLSLSGTTFSPSQFESKTGLSLDDKNEPGDLGQTGKYRGKPIPYGSATLRAGPKSSAYGPQLDALLSKMESSQEFMRQCGVESSTVWIVVYAEDGEQRNLEFTPIRMGKLSALGATLAVSNYTKE